MTRHSITAACRAGAARFPRHSTRGLALAANGDIVVAGYTVEVVGPDEFTDLFVARLIGDPPPMFVDGFESGDTSAWSVTVGMQ